MSEITQFSNWRSQDFLPDLCVCRDGSACLSDKLVTPGVKEDTWWDRRHLHAAAATALPSEAGEFCAHIGSFVGKGSLSCCED